MERHAIPTSDDDALRTLYAHLDALRTAEDPYDRAHERRWLWLESWVRPRASRAGDAKDDVTHEVLLAIARNVSKMDATLPLQAAKWVSMILRRKQIDALRARRAGDEALAFGEDDALEQVAAPEVRPDATAALEAFHARVDAVVGAYVDATESKPATRLLKRAQARAAIGRLVRELDSDAIEAELAYPEPIGKDRLYKWIERGRPTVAAALEAWIAEDDTLEAPARVIIETMEERRADAGRPRPERFARGKASSADTSVDGDAALDVDALREAKPPAKSRRSARPASSKAASKAGASKSEAPKPKEPRPSAEGPSRPARKPDASPPSSDAGPKPRRAARPPDAVDADASPPRPRRPKPSDDDPPAR